MAARSIAERAERISRRRARILPVLGVVFLSQQTAFFSQLLGWEPRSAEKLTLSAWVVTSAILIAVIATGGTWFRPREIRALVDDENTRANREDAMRWGYLFAMVAALGVYTASLFQGLTAQQAVHVVVSFGVAPALLRWGVLERRAHRDD